MRATTPKTRVCTTCGEEKLLGCFHKSVRGTYGHQSSCKVCLKETAATRYRGTPEGREKYREYVRKYRRTPLGALRAYSAGAKKRGLEFELTLESIEVLLGQPCHYCGSVTSQGLDRVDNTVGYTLSNTVPCCKTCNLMKYKFTETEFLEKCHRISSRWSGDL